MTNLGKCVEDFSTGPLTDYVNTLKGWKEVSSTLDNAIKAGPEELKKVAGEAAPRIKLLLGDTKSFDEAGRVFYENFKSCPESTSSGIVLMKSAFNVTVDSINNQILNSPENENKSCLSTGFACRTFTQPDMRRNFRFITRQTGYISRS
ncbi:MAG: hypothetical protein MZV63_52695 [Marinilabiliales bacterium]|nr:hypothetical protein [Marinilabiliales bacterium]